MLYINIMNNFKLFSILFLIIYQSFAIAQECINVNLYETQPELLKVPTEDQSEHGSLGICYATTASQLANYALLKNSSHSINPAVVHPIWLALQYKLNKENEDNLDGGYSLKSLMDVSEKYNCPYEVVQKTLTKTHDNLAILFNNLPISTIEKEMLKSRLENFKILDFIKMLIANLKNNYTNKFTNEKDKKNDLYDIPEVAQESTAINNFFYYKSTPNKVLENTVSASFNLHLGLTKYLYAISEVILKTLNQQFGNLNDLKNILDYTNRVLSKGCSKYKKSKINLNMDFNIFKKIEFTNNNLQKGYPVGAYVNADYIENTDEEVEYSPIYNHALIIVGSRKKNGTCEYLLRNSWGDQRKFNLLNEKSECTCLIDNKIFNNCNVRTVPINSNAKFLGCWMERKNVFPLLSQAFIIK